MGYKVNHYAAKTVTPNPQLDIETIAIELSVGAILMVMAIGGFNVGILLMAIPCGLISVACFLLSLNSIWHYISDRRKAAKEAEKNGC